MAIEGDCHLIFSQFSFPSMYCLLSTIPLTFKEKKNPGPDGSMKVNGTAGLSVLVMSGCDKLLQFVGSLEGPIC